MNIKREFLYNEEKLIPIQLISTNYGSAEVDPSIGGEVVLRSREVEVKFPIASSNVIMVINDGGEIVEVKSAPPGTSTVSISVTEGDSFFLYVISKEYEDGFIKGDHTVGGDPSSSDRLVLTYADATQQIFLDEDGAMVESRGRDTRDETQ